MAGDACSPLVGTIDNTEPCNGTGEETKTSNARGTGSDDLRDPPSKLIGQFLHKQKESGDFSIDIDLDMAELQNEKDFPFPDDILFTVPESSNGTPTAALNRVSFVNSSGDSLRRRNSSRNAEKDDLSSSSDRPLLRKSSLLKEKPKSRLQDPSPRFRYLSNDKIGFKSGFQAKTDEEEDDSMLDDDLPDELKHQKIDKWILLEWLSLILIVAALTCTLLIHNLRKKELWMLSLWKWEVLVLVLICGRLVSGWGVRIAVFLIERNFLLRKRVLYFVYGVKTAVQNCLWLGLVLVAWHYLFDRKVAKETNSAVLKAVSKVLVCLVLTTFLWLVKTLIVKVLASSFHVSTYFDRIQDSLFNQYVIETLSGPPLIEHRKNEEEAQRLAVEMQNLQNAGAIVPPELEPVVPRSGNEPRLSRTLSSKGNGITIDHLHKLTYNNVSAWNMKRFINIIRHGALYTLDEQIQGHGKDDDTAIRSEYEAKAAARKIFQNVAKPGRRFIYMADLSRFMQEEEAVKTMMLFEGAYESKRLTKRCLKNWVVNAFRERRALALTLNDTKTAVNKLHRLVNIVLGILIFIVWLVILGIATTKLLLFVSSQLVVVAFIFGNTCKTVFEAIIFLFVIHPFDVGDRCEIDGVQLVVEEMNILTTVFLRYDNQKVIIPNSVLATKGIGNFYRSPDMGDAVEFLVHIATPAEKIASIKHRISSYIEEKTEHWAGPAMIIVKDVEDFNRVRVAVWVTHRMNHQDIGERWVRRSLLVEEMVKIFKDLDLNYRLLPLDVNIIR